MAHQSKRPYGGSQPSITSYFSPSNSPPAGKPSYNITSSISADTRSPALPYTVQSDLLSVGMRVRKSVPEGYKTGDYSGFGLFSDGSLLNCGQSSPARIETGGGEEVKTDVVRRRARAGALVRELTPFCGILKVGGMAQQERWGIYETERRDEDMDDEDVPALSQGSIASNDSVGPATPMGIKRRFFEDGEEEVDGGGERLGSGLRLGERVLAVPKRKKWAGKGMVMGGQENAGIVGEDCDFEEADFLDYGLVMNGEVEMGGV